MNSENYKIIAYLLDGSGWVPDDICTSKLTHINYCFAGVKDGRLDTGHLQKLNYVKELKQKSPQLQILLCVGGLGARTFSDVALAESSCKVFAQSAAQFLDENGLDGIDIDWEYPCSSACGFIARPEDKHNFTVMLKSLREALDALGRKNGRHYSLTIAAGAGSSFAEHTEMNVIYNYLDYINIMTYDYHNSLEKTTGHHTNLFQSVSESETSNTDGYVNILLRAGVPAGKITIGAAFYGRGWENVSGEDNGLYQPASSDKELAYSYDELAAGYINRNGYKRFWDEDAMAPYLFDGGTFISYDDEDSVYYKAKYVKDKKLAGMMFWEYTQNKTGALLNKIYKTLK